LENQLGKLEHNIIIYQSKSGALELRGDISNENIWATQAQIAELFEIDRTVATRHIANILKDKEILEKSNVHKMHIANSDKPVNFYSLDIVLAVGYRTNSNKAIAFRRWASTTLRQHLVDGYTINKKILIKNSQKFHDALDKIIALLPAEATEDVNTVLDLVHIFANTWFSLDSFDKDNFPARGITVKKVKLKAVELRSAIDKLKQELLSKDQATELFSKELKKDGLESIIGNIFQSFGGKEIYPSLEEKAANILYLIVKNHPFVDGNKRCGAFAFIWFLKKFNLLPINLRAEALTAITLLIAISDAKEKDRMIGLILLLLNNKID
jgi:prophage maintenance system killer protein